MPDPQAGVLGVPDPSLFASNPPSEKVSLGWHNFVIDYQADATGVNVSTTAVNNAFAGASTAGGVAYVPPGTFKMDANGTPGSNSRVMGTGQGGTLSFVDDGTTTSKTLYLNNVSDVVLDSFVVTQTNVGGRTGLYGDIRIGAGCNRISVLNVRITAGSSIGIYAENTTSLLIQGCRVSGMYADGIHVNRQSSRVRVFMNDVFDTGDDAIAINSNTDPAGTYQAVTDVTVIGNTVYSLSSRGAAASSGIKVIAQKVNVGFNAVNTTIADGIIVASGPTGALSTATMRYPFFITIVGNTITNFSQTTASTGGIRVTQCRGVTIVGNTIDTGALASSVGIGVLGVAKEVVIADNYISRTGANGILVSQTTSADARLILELFTNLGDAGVATANLSEITVRGNALHKLGGLPILIQGNVSPNQTPGVVVEGNDIELITGSAIDGLHLNNCIRATVADNRFRVFGAVTTGGAIRLSTVTDASVVGNTAVACCDTGLLLIGATTQVTVTGNDFSNNTTFGVWDDGAGSNNTIQANTLRGNGNSGYTGTNAGTIVRGNPGYNPVGVVTPAVPASTVAVAAVVYDRNFWITTGAGATTIAIQGGPTITLQASVAGQYIRVPAGQTMTPTYANAPTWVVEGE